MTEFVVRIPPGADPGRGVFISGDAELLGDWRADAVPLKPQADGTWRATLTLPRGLRSRWLVTLGSWRQVESEEHHRERRPRELTVQDDAAIDARVAGWGRNSLKHYDSVRSPHLPSPRPITVWLPPGYDLEPQRRYPVFYIHDGQNLFDARTAFGGVPWRCDETAERLIRTGAIRPVILVGIGNTAERIKEYGPSRKRPGVADLSKAYGRFVAEELKPFIDSEYRTLTGPADTAVGGSSMGGLISLYICRWYPKVFGRCAAMSPSLWYNREAFLRTVRARSGWLKNCRIWLDFGSREGYSQAGMQAGLQRVRDLAAAFRELGLEDIRDFHYAEIADGHHNEAAWGARFDQVLIYLFGRG